MLITCEQGIRTNLVKSVNWSRYENPTCESWRMEYEFSMQTMVRGYEDIIITIVIIEDEGIFLLDSPFGSGRVAVASSLSKL